MANMAQALRMALHYGETHFGVEDIFGEDVGAPLGGVFTATQGLVNAWNTPLDERGIIGMAMGIAMTGTRCVAEIQFVDYIFNTIDLLKQAGNTLWCSNGQYEMPLVVMSPVGAGIHGSIYHSHSFDSWATRLPGWKVVLPSSPIDAYGLMLSSILDPNPVLYLVPKALMRVRGEELIPGETKESPLQIDAPLKGRELWRPQWPSGLTSYQVPIGKSKIIKPGKDATVITYGRHVFCCIQAVKRVEEQTNASIEIIDLRSLYPYDWAAISESVNKTKKVLLVNEDTEVTNFAEHLAYRIVSEFFYILEARPHILSGKQIPGIGLHPHLEEATLPQENDIEEELHKLLNESP